MKGCWRTRNPVLRSSTLFTEKCNGLRRKNFCCASFLYYFKLKVTYDALNVRGQIAVDFFAVATILNIYYAVSIEWGTFFETSLR